MNQDRALLLVLVTTIVGGVGYAAYETRPHSGHGAVLAAAPSPAFQCQELRTDCDPKTGLSILPTRVPTAPPTLQPTSAPTEQATDQSDDSTPDSAQEAYGPGPGQQTAYFDRPIRVSIIAKETQPDGLYIKKCVFSPDQTNSLTVNFSVANDTDHVVNNFEFDFDTHANPRGWQDYTVFPTWFGTGPMRIPPHHYFEATHVMQYFFPHTDIIHCYLRSWVLDGEYGD
jgi:hypothetical protein